MRWLQGTFATRFNRFHGERGHVFQGRYNKSLVVEEDRPLLGLIKRCCRGWFLGSKKAKKELAKELVKGNNGKESLDRRAVEDGAPELRQQLGKQGKSLDFAFDPCYGRFCQGSFVVFNS